MGNAERAPRLSQLRRQDAIREGEGEGEAKVEDPNDPLFPTTILDLNRNTETCKNTGQTTTPNIIVSSPQQPVRPNQLSIVNPLRPSGSSDDGSGFLTPGENDVEIPEGIGQILGQVLSFYHYPIPPQTPGSSFPFSLLFIYLLPSYNFFSFFFFHLNNNYFYCSPPSFVNE